MPNHPSRWGIIVDIAAIAAVTALAVLKVLPEAVTATVITMVIAGRFRPPGDNGGTGTPPSPPTGQSKAPSAAAVSGLLMTLSGLWNLVKR